MSDYEQDLFTIPHLIPSQLFSPGHDNGPNLEMGSPFSSNTGTSNEFESSPIQNNNESSQSVYSDPNQPQLGQQLASNTYNNYNQIRNDEEYLSKLAKSCDIADFLKLLSIDKSHYISSNGLAHGTPVQQPACGLCHRLKAVVEYCRFRREIKAEADVKPRKVLTLIYLYSCCEGNKKMSLRMWKKFIDDTGKKDPICLSQSELEILTTWVKNCRRKHNFDRKNIRVAVSNHLGKMEGIAYLKESLDQLETKNCIYSNWHMLDRTALQIEFNLFFNDMLRFYKGPADRIACVLEENSDQLKIEKWDPKNYFSIQFSDNLICTLKSSIVANLKYDDQRFDSQMNLPFYNIGFFVPVDPIISVLNNHPTLIRKLRENNLLVISFELEFHHKDSNECKTTENKGMNLCFEIQLVEHQKNVPDVHSISTQSIHIDDANNNNDNNNNDNSQSDKISLSHSQLLNSGRPANSTTRKRPKPGPNDKESILSFWSLFLLSLELEGRFEKVENPLKALIDALNVSKREYSADSAAFRDICDLLHLFSFFGSIPYNIFITHLLPFLTNSDAINVARSNKWLLFLITEIPLKGGKDMIAATSLNDRFANLKVISDTYTLDSNRNNSSNAQTPIHGANNNQLSPTIGNIALPSPSNYNKFNLRLPASDSENSEDDDITSPEYTVKSHRHRHSYDFGDESSGPNKSESTSPLTTSVIPSQPTGSESTPTTIGNKLKDRSLIVPDDSDPEGNDKLSTPFSNLKQNFSNQVNVHPVTSGFRSSPPTQSRSAVVRRESYIVTQTGSFQAHGFEIDEKGIVMRPNVPTHKNDNVNSNHLSIPNSNTNPNFAPTAPANRPSDASIVEIKNTENEMAHAELAKGSASSDEICKEEIKSTLQVPALVENDPNGLDNGIDDHNKNGAEANFEQTRNRATSLGMPVKLEDLIKLGELGRGSTGAVLKALYLPTLSIVALKSVSIYNQKERHQMINELKVLNSVHNPHILGFIGSCFYEGKLTMVLEFMNRGSLDQVVRKYGALSEFTIKTIATHTLIGLSHLHGHKQLHRDIKPHSLLVDSKGQCKISDFGLVKQLEDTEEMCSTFVGTMMYLSPERIMGDQFSYSADIWSLGLSLIYCARGKLDLPKDYWALIEAITSLSKPEKDNNSSPFSLDPQIYSDNFRSFVHKCLQKEPEARGSADSLLQHPFITSPSPPGSDTTIPYANIEPPNNNELDIIVCALINRYYPNPTDAYTQGTTQVLAHCQHLAVQLGCSFEAVRDAFCERIKPNNNKPLPPIITLASRSTPGVNRSQNWASAPSERPSLMNQLPRSKSSRQAIKSKKIDLNLHQPRLTSASNLNFNISTNGPNSPKEIPTASTSSSQVSASTDGGSD